MTPRVMVLASGNAGKLAELKRLIGGMPFDVRPQSDYGLTTPPETGETFAANALLKARYACRETGCLALADDSGLIVDALNGEPGIYSARYAGKNAGPEDNVRKLLAKLSPVPAEDRKARFFCALACVFPAPDEPPLEVHAAWEGFIADAPCGKGGFGYDPVFFVPGKNCTAAQLSPDVKAVLSHRGKALSRLRHVLLMRCRQSGSAA